MLCTTRRHEEADQLREDVVVLKKRLHDKTGQYDHAMTVVAKQKAAIQDLEDNLTARNQDVEDRDATIDQ